MNAHAQLRCVLAALLGPAIACGREEHLQRVQEAFRTGRVHPDEAPHLVTSEPPFRYPVAMYARKAQGNVLLQLYIDRDGAVLRDSTRVEQSSGFPALDSAALRGSGDLRFVPAKLHGEPMGMTVLFPVYFRHPEAPPLAGDSILNRSPSH